MLTRKHIGYGILTLLLAGSYIDVYPQSERAGTVDAQNKRQGKWTIYYDEDWRETTHRDSAEYYRIITYKNDLPVGLVKDYFKDGTLQFEGRMINDRPDPVMEGEVTWYWQNGIYAKGKYTNGALADSVALFDANGKRIRETWEGIAKKYKPLYDNGQYDKVIEILEVGKSWSEINLGKENQYYLTCIFYLGNSYYFTVNMEKTAPLYKEGVKLYAKLYGTQSSAYGILLSNLGKVYLYLANYTAARKVLLEALEVINSTEGKSAMHYATVANYLGRALKNTGDYPRAEAMYLESLQIQTTHQKTKTEFFGETLNNLGSLYLTLGDYKKAEQFYRESIEVRRMVLGTDHPDYFQSLQGLASTYRFMGNTEAALPLLFECRDGRLKKFGEANEEYIRTVMTIGQVYLDIGKYQQAEELLITARRLGEKADKNGIVYANTLHSIGQFYITLGNYKEAELALHEAQVIFRNTTGEESQSYVVCLGDLGVLYEKTGDLAKSEAIQRQSLSIKGRTLGFNHQEYATALTNLAAVNSELGKYDTARILLTQAIGIIKKTSGTENTTYCLLLSNLAGNLDNLSRYNEAEQLYHEAIAINSKLLSPLHLQSMLFTNNLAFHYLTRMKLSLAEPLFIQSAGHTTTLIQSLFPAMSENERKKFVEGLRLNLQNFEAFCIARASENPTILEHLYNTRLITKGMLLNSSTKVRKNILDSGDDKLTALFKEWQQAKDVLAKSYQTSATDQGYIKVDEQRLKDKINSLEKELSSRSQAFAPADKAAEWKDVQKRLHQGEVAIEIMRIVVVDSSKTKTSINYAALCITPESRLPKLITLKDGELLEGKYFHYYRNAIDVHVNDTISYRKFWKPFADVLTGYTKIYLSTDGVFNQINLNILKNPVTGKFVIDEMEIQLVGNTKDLIQPREERPIVSLSLFGNPDYKGNLTPTADARSDLSGTTALTKLRSAMDDVTELPGTKIEIEQIGRVATGKKLQVNYYLFDRATESNIKEIKNPGVLHIATHGYFLADEALEQPVNNNFFGMKAEAVTANPLFRSGLLFAGSEKTIHGKFKGLTEDGVLTAYEAMNMNLDKTSLVVLSACETGLGVQQNGEGIYGLQRAFQIAGARSILMSLWKVDDQVTKELMILFYTHWLEGVSIQKAFRTSQIEIRNKFPNTSQWGAFILLGD